MVVVVVVVEDLETSKLYVCVRNVVKVVLAAAAADPIARFASRSLRSCTSLSLSLARFLALFIYCHFTLFHLFPSL